MKIDSAQFDVTFEQFRNYLKQGKFKPTLETLLNLLQSNQEKTLKLIKANALFRHSRYLTSKNIIAEITNAALSSDTIALSTSNKTYFRSINLFQVAYKELKDLDRLIREFFKRKYRNAEGFKASFPKTLIAYADYLFQLGKRQFDCLDPDNLEFYGNESIIEGISYLIYLYTRTHRLNNDDLGFIDEEFISSHAIDRLILYATQTKKILDLEMLIDYFGYECNMTDGNLLVFHSDQLFDKTLNIGDILNEMQEVSNVVQYKETEEEALSLKKLAERISANEEDFFYLSKHNGYERYRLALPDNFFDQPLFKEEALFDEEQWKLYGYHKETLYGMAEISKFTIGKTLNLWDLIIIQRGFLILNYLYTEKIFERNPNNIKHILRSIAAFSEEELVTLLSPLVGRSKVKEFLELFSWQQKDNHFLDLQYQPILKINGQYLLPLRLISFSNLLRNVVASQAQKGINIKVENQSHMSELLSKYLFEKLNLIGFEVRRNTIIKYGKITVELDLIASRDDYVIIMECKENISPTTVREMRNTLNSVSTAQGQLDNITALLQDDNFRIKFQSKLGFDLGSRQIFTCVGVINNMFLGTTFFSHPIKNVYDFLNFFESGIIKFKNMHTGEKDEFLQWKGKNPTVNDVKNYFEEAHGLNSIVFKHAKSFQLLLRSRILFTVYGVDFEDIEHQVEASYSTSTG